ncbi:hypothetical protein AHS42_21755 [Salmonella enterica subsp. enterica]|nr:hypothetical protein [Salmonella enterica subsp. enterica serovar Mbandaka]
MVSILYDLIKSGINFFTKTKTIEQEVKSENAEGQIEVNKIEIEKTTIHWRNVLGLVLTLIVLYSYIIIPFFAYFGIVLINLPLEPIFKLLFVLLGTPM